jgi:hypothetical protein
LSSNAARPAELIEPSVPCFVRPVIALPQ